MNSRYSIATALLAIASLALVSAQGVPSAPRNLRIVAKNSSGPKVPECVVAPGGGAQHAYFDSLVALPQHHCNWSLRSQEQLDSLTNLRASSYFRYSPATDNYPTPQDAAKFYKPVDDQIGKESDSIPGNQQLKMPIGISDGSVLITWDFWYGPEFRTNIGAIANYKMFQVRQGASNRWWTILNRWTLASGNGEVSRISNSMDGVNSSNWPAGMSQFKPFTPGGAGAVAPEEFSTYYGRWTRYWLEIRLNQPHTAFGEWMSQNSKGVTGTPAQLSGTWHMLSLWVADEQRAPQRVLYRVPWTMVGANNSIGSFDFELNTSSAPPGQTGPLVGYGRNVVVLRNYQLPAVPETDTRIFVRP